MQSLKRPAPRPFLLAGIFAALHLVLILYLLIVVWADPKADEGAFITIYLVDFPIVPLLNDGANPVACAAIGCLLWFCYGFVLQSLLFVRRTAGVARLVIGVLAVALLWSIPEISLRMKPPWEEQRSRAWAIERGPGTNAQKAIGYVSEAIRLSPKDNPELGNLWNYLGELYMDQKDYVRAENAFKSHLDMAQAQPRPDPRDLLGAYAELSSVYRASGNTLREREALEKELDLLRLTNGGNPAREVNILQTLAQIDHDTGKSKEAQDLLSRAIQIESNLHDQNFPFNYWNHKLQSWKAEK